MSDNVDFFAAGIFNDIIDSFGNFGSAVLDGGSGAVVAVENDGTVFLKFSRNSAPVVKDRGVSEKYAVNQKNRVFKFAYLKRLS